MVLRPEKFTEQAQQVLATSQEIVQRFRHSQWDVEHILLALMELEQVMVEPSAAISIAGLADHRDEVAGKRVAAILTGSYLRPDLLPAVLRTGDLL